MGYPESLTDPSYAGQLMTLTYPLVGNYGVPPFTIEDNGIATFMESDRIYAKAIIVSDYSEAYSHWNAKESLADWLKREQVPGVTGIDTRALTKVLREHGVMMGHLEFEGLEGQDLLEDEDYASINWVERVSCKDVIRYNEGAGARRLRREEQYHPLSDTTRRRGDSRALELRLYRDGLRRTFPG